MKKILKKSTKGSKKSKTTTTEICANCGKDYEETQLGGWTTIILNYKPACSVECNMALGQIKER